jgi:hypothetical protein
MSRTYYVRYPRDFANEYTVYAVREAYKAGERSGGFEGRDAYPVDYPATPGEWLNQCEAATVQMLDHALVAGA